MEKEGIDAEFSSPYTSELHGTAERFNRTLQEKIIVLIFGSGLPKSMWEVAAHVHNRTPHKPIDFETPLKKFAFGTLLPSIRIFYPSVLDVFHLDCFY